MREIIFYENHFLDFYFDQDEKVQEKIQYVLELIRQVDRVPEKFLKHLADSKGLYEVRVEYNSNIFRIFCCFDKGKLVVLFNGFQKNSRRTPKAQLERATALMKKYFDNKMDQDEEK